MHEAVLTTNFTGTKWVKFGTRKATFKIMSATSIVATVPKHARSGKIWVHSAGGTSSSGQRFAMVARSV